MSIERVERKSGVVWRVRWRDAAGRAHSKVVGRKRDAEAFEAEIVRRKRTGEIDLFGAGKQTLAEFAEEWWRLYAVPNLAVRTRRSYAGLWDRHVLGRLAALTSRLRASGSPLSTARLRSFRVCSNARSNGSGSHRT